MPIELTVTLKNEERTYKEKFLSYEDFSLSVGDVVLSGYVEKTKKGFLGKPDEISIKTTMIFE